MMNKLIIPWLWKWHFLGGIVVLPFVLLLAITGCIYLFKDNYETEHWKSLREVSVQSQPLSLEKQWELANEGWERKNDALILSTDSAKATEFVSGRFSHKSTLLLDPYTGEVTGKFIVNQTDMHKVRKLHGELLLGKPGTLIVEAVASWMVVLLISGIVIFWPRERGWKGLVTIRTKGSKRLLFRDIHGVLGFWFSAMLLLILAGGLPWTDIFGTSFKWVQETTHTGYPHTWYSGAFKSTVNGERLTLDQMAAIGKDLHLEGEVTLQLPRQPTDVFSVYNQTHHLEQMQLFHFDQYSGEMLKHHTWQDIGVMMKTRLWVMAFHQGQFGTWNFILVFGSALALIVLSIAAIISYFKRKPKGGWGIPTFPSGHRVPIGLGAVVAVLGVILPLFGASVVVMVILNGLKRLRRSP